MRAVQSFSANAGLRPLLLRGAAVLCVGAASACGAAAERAAEFLDGLLQRGLYEVALDYLEQMRTSPLAPRAFQETIDYETAVTLVAAAHALGPIAEREHCLDAAQVSLHKFLADHPRHVLTPSARTRLVSVLVERARLMVEAAAQQSQAADREPLLSQARSIFSKAQAAFAAAERQLDEQYAKFPKVAEKGPGEAQELVRRQLVEVQLLSAAVPYEIAQTYAPDLPERKRSLKAAAARYGEVYQRYPKYLVGLLGRLEQARCYKELGDAARAQQSLAELLSLSEDAEPFRVLRNKACVLALEADLLPEVKNYAGALAQSEAWTKTSPASDQASAEGRSVKCLAGMAWLETARPRKADDPQCAEALAQARRLLLAAARDPGPYQALAIGKLSDPLLAGKSGHGARGAITFAEAQSRGQEALDRMQNLEEQDKSEAAEGKVENHQRYQEEIADARDEALGQFQTALALAGQHSLAQGQPAAADIPADRAPVEALNQVRYDLAFLCWTCDRPYDAALLGEFLARRHPQSENAAAGAKVALASYLKLMGSARRGADRSFESQRMASIAELIVNRWPNQPEAEDAWMMLIRTSILSGDLPRAMQYLQQIGPASPRRAEIELMAGQALWAAYLKTARLPDAQRPPQDRLDQMIVQARQTLQEGIERMRKAGAEHQSRVTLVAAALTLAQIAIGTGDPEAAVALLEDKQTGPVTAIARGDQEDPVVQDFGLVVEIHKAALQAYVGAQKLDQAEKALNDLEKLALSQGEEAGKLLTQIDIGLGRELEGQLNRFRQQQKADQLQKLSRGFELFLGRIAQRDAGTTFSSLNWVAEIFASLAAGYDQGGKLSAEAQGYFESAAATYQQILARAADDPQFVSNREVLMGIQVRLARTLRRLGQYQGALDTLAEILKQRVTLISVQVEAAYTYQAWGEAKPACYLLAIRGGHKYQKADGTEDLLLWGWGRISKVLQRSPAHVSTFHEARYNLAQCRLKYALACDGKQEQAEALEQAERDILIVQRLYPEMGGPDGYEKYDTLLKSIQRLRGQVQPGGLKATTTPAN